MKPMQLIDTHCHLTHPRLRRNLPDVLDRSKQAGVIAIICAAGNVEESKAGANLSKQHPHVYFTAAVHPHDAKDATPGYLDAIEHLSACDKNVAIGEIGLDYHYNFSPPDVQRKIFAQQLELSKGLRKKVVIHTREAFDDTLAILRESGIDGRNVAFHSFTEGPDRARKVLDFGATIGFSGIVTFRKSSDLHETARLVPDDRFLVETDGPFLSPEPVRKMRTNEPANVIHVAEFLGTLRNTTGEAIASLTTANALRLFQLDTP